MPTTVDKRAVRVSSIATVRAPLRRDCSGGCRA
jgi:hypothetical protein